MKLRKFLYGAIIGVFFVGTAVAYTVTTPRVTVGSFLTKSLWDLVVDDLMGLMNSIDANIADIATNATDIATNTTNLSGIVPTGAVMYFNLSACPTGWSDLIAARGRYMLGLPAGGSLGASIGNGLSNMEDRAVGQHTHGVSDPGHAHGIEQGVGTGGITWAISRSASGTTFNDSTTESTGIVLLNAGAVNGTNAPYLQLLVCQKN